MICIQILLGGMFVSLFLIVYKLKIMKKFTTILLFTAIIRSVFAQAPTQAWLSTYDGAANKDDYFEAMALDNNGDVIAIGSVQNTSGNYDFATVKYNGSTGAKIWEATYNYSGNSEDVATALVIDASNNIFVAGYGGNGYWNGGNDIITIKYNFRQ